MKRFVILAATAGMLVAAPAMADVYFQLKELDTAPGATLQINVPGFYSGGAWAGVYRFGLQDAPSYPSRPTWLPTWGFCIEMAFSDTSNYRTYHTIDLDEAPIDDGPGGQPMGLTKAQEIQRLWGYKYDDLQTWAATNNRNDATMNSGAALFQAAVWKIVYGNGVTFTQSVEQNIAVLRQTASGYTGSLPSLSAYTNDTYQDYVVQIPVPGAVLLGLFGFSLIGWVKRRFA